MNTVTVVEKTINFRLMMKTLTMTSIVSINSSKIQSILMESLEFLFSKRLRWNSAKLFAQETQHALHSITIKPNLEQKITVSYGLNKDTLEMVLTINYVLSRKQKLVPSSLRSLKPKSSVMKTTSFLEIHMA